MSPELKQFYLALQKWIDDGAVDNRVFARSTGICASIVYWNRRNTPFPEHNGIAIEFKKQLADRGLDTVYPWGEIEYDDAMENGTMYEDPKRLAWIAEHAA